MKPEKEKEYRIAINKGLKKFFEPYEELTKAETNLSISNLMNSEAKIVDVIRKISSDKRIIAGFKEVFLNFSEYIDRCIKLEEELKNLVTAEQYEKIDNCFSEIIPTNGLEKLFSETIDSIKTDGFDKAILKLEAMQEGQEEKNESDSFDINSQILEKGLPDVTGKAVKSAVKEGILTPEQAEVITEIFQLNSYPTSPATHNINLILNGMGSTRSTRVNRNTKFNDWTTEDGEYISTFENKNGITIISVDNINELTKRYDKNVKKLFIFALQKAGQIYFSGDIVFPLQELVDLGMYKTVKSARNGFLNSADKLLKIAIGGETIRGKKSIKNEKGQLFIYRKVENSMCTITINPKLNAEFIAQFFSLLPKWSYKLNNKAFNLVEYIYFLARQKGNIIKLKSKGHFNISFSAINDYLQQPSPKETPNHTRDIVDPIIDAITEIEEAQEGTDCKLTPIYSYDYKNAVEFLQGYLQVEFSGETLEYFIERANDQEKEFKKVQARKEKALLEVEKKKLKK